eukprot:67138_1
MRMRIRMNIKIVMKMLWMVLKKHKLLHQVMDCLNHHHENYHQKKIINDAIVYQAQPPQIELNEVKKQQRNKNNNENNNNNNNENESEPLMDENNDIEYYNGDMIIK